MGKGGERLTAPADGPPAGGSAEAYKIELYFYTFTRKPRGLNGRAAHIFRLSWGYFRLRRVHCTYVHMLGEYHE